MLMGQIYYENDQLKKSYRAFKKGSRLLVDRDNGFAWGVANISNYSYKRAIVGFKKVKKKNKVYPYATYYLGVSYFNLKMWFKAKRYFMKPVMSMLPANLQRNRERFLNLIDKEQSRQVSSIISKISSTSYSAAAPVKNQGWDHGQSSAYIFRKTKKGLKMRYKRGLTYAVNPSVNLKQFDAKYQNHGYTTNQSAYFGYNLGATGGLDYRFKAKENSPLFRLGLSANVGSYNAKVSDYKLFSIEGVSGAFTNEQSFDVDESTLGLMAEPTYYHPFNSSLSASVSAIFSTNVPEVDFENIWGMMGGKLGIAFDKYKFSLRLGGSVANLYDYESGMSTLDIEGSIKGDVKFGLLRVFSSFRYLSTSDPSFRSRDRYRYFLADNRIRYVDDYLSQMYADVGASIEIFSAEIEGKFSYLQRTPVEKEDGSVVIRDFPTDPIRTASEVVMDTSALLTIPLIFDSYLYFEGAYNILYNYTFAYTVAQQETEEEAQSIEYGISDADQILYKLGFVFVPVDWFSINISYESRINTYTSAQAETREFQQVNPDLAYESTIFLEVAKTF